MNTTQTLDQMQQLRLQGMYQAYRSHLNLPLDQQLESHELVAHLTQAEELNRSNEKTATYVKAAKLRLSATIEQVSWVLTSYVLASAVAMPLMGYLAVRLGRKRVLITCVIGFTLLSMLCGVAQSLPQMVVFRVLQGFFGAGLVPISQTLLLDVY
ncbi:MAG: MFS transporter, partial [Sphingobacteriales bacterium]